MEPDRCDPDCHGYFVSGVDRPPWNEIEKCDQCAVFPDDDAAAARFVRDLELRKAHAVAMARELIGDFQEEDAAVCDCDYNCDCAILFRDVGEEGEEAS